MRHVGLAPASTARIEAVWGRAPDGRPVDAVEVIGIRRSVLRGLRGKVASDTGWPVAIRVVVAGQSPDSPTPAIVGRYVVLSDRIRFEPRFPFAPGVDYRAEVDSPRLDALAGVAESAPTFPRLTHRFTVPAEKLKRSTRIVAVHPTADRLPSNALRWYIEFSAPMEPGTAHEHVQLLDEAGRPVHDAFLRVDDELWDVERRRLTLLFDPGRVKRGVRANIEMGAPLVEGHRYRLVIDPRWLDARGAALASGYEKEFDVGPADRDSPYPGRWIVSAPAAGTREPLRVSFAEPLDHALIRRMLKIESGARPVEGVITVPIGDSSWTFTPTVPWQAGHYRIGVDVRLEDVAGNNVARVFDADRAAGAPAAEDRERSGASRTIEFRVR